MLNIRSLFFCINFLLRLLKKTNSKKSKYENQIYTDLNAIYGVNCAIILCITKHNFRDGF